MPQHISIGKTALWVAGMDTLVALLAGLAIFPLVIAYGLHAGSGPGLIFVTLPLAFGQMPFGTFIGTLFFIMLTFATLTSTIALLGAQYFLVDGEASDIPFSGLCSGGVGGLGA